MEALLNIMESEYKKNLDLQSVEGSKTFKELINTKDTPSMKRWLAFIDLKYKLTMYKSGYLYTPFKATIKGISIIYASIYWYNNRPIYAVLSPTYESSKGEFRDGFILYKMVELV